LILVSPLTRTIETATRAFEDHATPKRLCHLLCEAASSMADHGTPKSDLLKKHPHIAQWDGWNDLPEHFWPSRTLVGAREEAASRVDELKRFIFQRPEHCFALVGHSNFFREMTGQESKLANCEAWWCTLSEDGAITPCQALPPPPSAV
jgi:broad specificity phosphatase PhoE